MFRVGRGKIEEFKWGLEVPYLYLMRLWKFFFIIEVRKILEHFLKFIFYNYDFQDVPKFFIAYVLNGISTGDDACSN